MHVGLDWAYRSAQWCALAPGGELAGEGRVAADRDGLARLVLELGDEVTARLEMISGAAWERDELVACGRQVEVADARKVKTVAPLAAKTDKVDARLLAEPCRRQLVPASWLPSLDERTGAAGTAAPADASGAAPDGREGSDFWSADAVGRPRLVGAPAPLRSMNPGRRRRRKNKGRSVAARCQWAQAGMLTGVDGGAPRGRRPRGTSRPGAGSAWAAAASATTDAPTGSGQGRSSSQVRRPPVLRERHPGTQPIKTTAQTAAANFLYTTRV